MSGFEMIALGLSAAGSVVQTISGMSAAKSQQKANAAIIEQNAEYSRQQQAQEELSIRRRLQQAQASSKAALAASGVDVSEGSSLEIFAENERNAALDLAMSRYEGDMRQRQFALQGYQNNLDAANARSRAIGSGIAGLGQVAQAGYRSSLRSDIPAPGGSSGGGSRNYSVGGAFTGAFR